MCDIVWMSTADTHFIWESDPISFDVCRSDLVLSGNGSVMGSFTSEALITVADCQSSRHRLVTEAVVSAAGLPLQRGCLDRGLSVG